jgi:probable F420-dependent oxidoreductase
VATLRKFRFGVTGRGNTLAEWRDFARKAEALGYSSLVLPDHFSRQFAPLLALTAAAQATSTLRLGTLVLDNDFRHPAVLAKEAATMDVLTDGRFELGIGTGSQPADNEHTGLPLDAPGVRVERFEETLHILRACFSAEETVSFEGKHYQVKDLPAFPKPVQKAGIPFLMGARGPRMLRLAAREADIIGIMSGPDGSSADRLNVVRESAGERFDRIEFNALYLRVQVEGQPEASGPLLNMPDLIGSREEIIQRLLAQREQHLVSYVVVVGTAIDAFAPIVARLSGV